MSRENVEIVRRALEAYTRRDVELLRALADPDMELDWSASIAWLAGVYRGVDEALRFYADYFEAFDEIVIEPDRFIDAGDSVVVPNVAYQRGRDGIQVSARSTLVFTIREGKLTRICLYQETEKALEAAGIASDRGGSPAPWWRGGALASAPLGCEAAPVRPPHRGPPSGANAAFQAADAADAPAAPAGSRARAR